MAKLLDGRSLAEEIKAKLLTLKNDFEQETGIKPGLAILRVGDESASELYVQMKGLSAKELGYHFEEHVFPAWVKPDMLAERISELNRAPHIHGIVLQLPLPSPLDKVRFLSLIDPLKDVDGLHPLNGGKLFQDFPGGFIPATPLGCLGLIQRIHPSLEGRVVGVVGASLLVGRPMAMVMLNQGCTVWIAHIKTQNLPQLCKTAEILIVGIGKPRFIQGDWIQEGATVVDVGMNKLPTGEVVGDVEFTSAEKRAGAITPVPGGVGPMTVISLLRNTLASAFHHNGKTFPFRDL